MLPLRILGAIVVLVLVNLIDGLLAVLEWTIVRPLTWLAGRLAERAGPREGEE